MLKNLVKKFKSHSLNEDGEMQMGHRPCCHQKQTQCQYHRYHQCPHKNNADTPNQQGMDEYERDSGTESDEELEYIETNSTHSVPISQTSDYYASQQSLSINSCRSSHCGSPTFGLSDQECNSWESIGSESGIGLRATPKAAIRPSQKQPTSMSFNFNYEFLLNPQYKTMNSSTSTTPTCTMAEELPNHHYHTRQQFQRLKQQISMKDGMNSVHTTNSDDQSISAGRSTAFSPFSRCLPMDSTVGTNVGNAGKNPGNSSMDEMEEINDNLGQNEMNPPSSCRRWRSSTLSTGSAISSSGVSTWSSCSSSSSASSRLGQQQAISEKRKWSQMRQKHTKAPEFCCCYCPECGLDQGQLEPRPVLHAARKTPVKLLFTLNDTMTVVQQQEKNAFMKLEHPEPNVRKTRFSTRKKCRADNESKSMDTLDNEDMDLGDGQTFVKRPSLDFDKMRAKRVDRSGKIDIKSRRSKSFNSGVMKSKFKESQQRSYHLRSKGYFFRPLDPPTPLASNAMDGQNQTSLNLFSIRKSETSLQ